jgi:hypothetical protein
MPRVRVPNKLSFLAPCFHFCCLQRGPVWLTRLAIDARASRTSAQSLTDVPSAAHSFVSIRG